MGASQTWTWSQQSYSNSMFPTEQITRVKINCILWTLLSGHAQWQKQTFRNSCSWDLIEWIYAHLKTNILQHIQNNSHPFKKRFLTSKKLVERFKMTRWTQERNRVLLLCARYLILELRISVSPHLQHHIEKVWWKNKSPSIWRMWVVYTDNTLQDTTALHEECQYTEWTFLCGQTLMSC